MRAKFIVSAVIIAASLATAPAWAATAAGRISYISSDGHTILINSVDEYMLGPKVDASKLSISEPVKVTYSARGKGSRLATDIVPNTAAP